GKLLVSTFSSTVWCFSFVSLFNLQGTRRISGTLLSISEPNPFVKNFFHSFSNFFQFALLIRRSRGELV
ncbi:MAG: hypothetical protein IKC24_06045, partial [Oscillospiraceae bacterium]|nr:hypothetical protein [Oscillospiraceae bacterium]